jgi:phage FluMu protein Com
VLRVKNKDIPRGFSLNIERGWDKLVHGKESGTLLTLINALDKNLEAFLSEKKTDTVTLVTFKDTRHLENAAAPLGNAAPLAASATTTQAPAPKSVYIPEESFTKEQIADAKAKRASEVRQLDSRMGRLSLFHKSADGIVYTLPLQPKRRTELPLELQVVQSVQLIIPLLYPLQPLRILLNDVESEDAERLEESFAEKAAQQKQMTLMSHINYLAQNMHILAKAAQASPKELVALAQEVNTSLESAKPSATGTTVNKDDKSHIHVISRPPEWAFINESEDSQDDSDDMSWDSEDDSDDGGATINPSVAPSPPAHQAESGTSISFPLVELHGIELLQVSILSINVKCERCRTINEMTGLRPDIEKGGSCKKCATTFVVKFRQEMVHQNSIRGGFIDTSGCTVSDMLPR